jgi:hypothetical protein
MQSTPGAMLKRRLKLTTKSTAINRSLIIALTREQCENSHAALVTWNLLAERKDKGPLSVAACPRLGGRAPGPRPLRPEGQARWEGSISSGTKADTPTARFISVLPSTENGCKVIERSEPPSPLSTR